MPSLQARSPGRVSEEGGAEKRPGGLLQGCPPGEIQSVPKGPFNSAAALGLPRERRALPLTDWPGLYNHGHCLPCCFYCHASQPF